MSVTIHYSCRPGIELVPKKDQEDLKYKLMEVFGSPAYTTYYLKIRDYKNIPYHVKASIDNIFSGYGISPVDAWHIWQTNEDE